MLLTYKKAKKLCLELWTILRDNPEFTDKVEVDSKNPVLYAEVMPMKARCPLCEVMRISRCADHKGNPCPLTVNARCVDYNHWVDAKDEKERAIRADNIIQRVSDWKPPFGFNWKNLFIGGIK